MQVLVHIGLNKCASTYVQRALAAARPRLARAGTWYPAEPARTCHYGLSRHYGFGPDAEGVTARSATVLVEEARRARCSRLILSSEYLSLYRPDAAAALAHDLAEAQASATYLMLSRAPGAWLLALFNQYVRTVEDGRYLPDINAFVDQVMANRTVDIARRYRQWAALGSVAHHRIDLGGDVLAPFRAFTRARIDAPAAEARNSSLGPSELYAVGCLRAAPRGPGRDAALARLLGGAAARYPAPEGYLTLDPIRRTTLRHEVFAAYEALPVTPLPDLAPAL